MRPRVSFCLRGPGVQDLVLLSTQAVAVNRQLDEQEVKEESEERRSSLLGPRLASPSWLSPSRLFRSRLARRRRESNRHLSSPLLAVGSGT